MPVLIAIFPRIFSGFRKASAEANKQPLIRRNPARHRKRIDGREDRSPFRGTEIRYKSCKVKERTKQEGDIATKENIIVRSAAFLGI